MIDPAALLTRLPDGTVKQHNPFTGTQVWTMPGRGKRPLPTSEQEVVDLPEGSDGLDGCAFCPGHHLDNPPEKARLVGEDDGYAPSPGWQPTSWTTPRRPSVESPTCSRSARRSTGG